MIDKFKEAWEQERFRVPAKIITAYALWKVFHHFAKVPNSILHKFWLSFVFCSGAIYAKMTSILLRPLVDHTFADGINIHLMDPGNYKIVAVQDHCLAIPATVVFTATVLFFRGSWRDKAWFIPAGIIGIMIINLLRLIFVCLALLHLTAYFFDLHHSVIYVAISYGFIFLMIVWWIRRNKTSNGAGGA